MLDIKIQRQNMKYLFALNSKNEIIQYIYLGQWA